MNPSQLSLFEAPPRRMAAQPAPEQGSPTPTFLKFVGDEKQLQWRHVRVYQRVRFGERWMISMVHQGPVIAVVTSPVAGDPPEQLDGEAWFMADLYDYEDRLILRSALVPNSAVFITESGFRAAVGKGVDETSLATTLSCLCEDAAAAAKASSSPATGKLSAEAPTTTTEPVQATPQHVQEATPPVQQRPVPCAAAAAQPMRACVILARPEGTQGRAPCNSRRWTEFVPWPDIMAQRAQHLEPWQRDPSIGSAFHMPSLPDAQRQVIAVTQAAVHVAVDGQTGIDPGAERRWVLCDVFVTGSATRWPVVIDGQQTALSVNLPGRVDQVLVPCVLLSEPVEVVFQ